MSERGYAHGVVGGEELLVKRGFVSCNIASHVFLKDLCEEKYGERERGVLCCEKLLIERGALGMVRWDGCVRVEGIAR